MHFRAALVGSFFVLNFSALLISCAADPGSVADVGPDHGDAGLLADAHADSGRVVPDAQGQSNDGASAADAGEAVDAFAQDDAGGGLDAGDEHADAASESDVITGLDAAADVDAMTTESDAALAIDASSGGEDASLSWFGRPDLSAVDQSGLSCTDDEDLMDKYFRYRRRLRGDGTAAYPGFIVRGEGPGRSMPAAQRRPNENCHGYWVLNQCPPDDDPDARGAYKWGDGTYWLGDYIAMLGLQYALYKDLGVATEETEHDLRDAIKAIDRLDLAADAFFASGNSELDGFYLRDDVPADLVTDSDGYTFLRDDGYSGYECVAGDLVSSCGNASVEDGSFTSQDQSIGLIFGLGVVAALLPDGVGDIGFDLRLAARARVHRLVMALRDNGWMVTAPDGTHPPGRWGGNAIGFSNQFAKAANTICGHDFGVDDYRDNISQNAGQSAWNGLMAIWSETPAHNRTLALRLAAFTDDLSPQDMADKSLAEGKDYFVLIYSLMQQTSLPAPFSPWRVEALLRSAPCQGPCWGTQGCNNTPGWRGESRNYLAGNRMGSRHSQEAEFNGIDYMALFASWHLYTHGVWSVLAAQQSTPDCSDYLSIDALRGMTGNSAEGILWDPAAACAAQDLYRDFCGRPFGAWVHDAMLGKASIHTGLMRWNCDLTTGCVLHFASSENTDGDDLILGSSAADDYSGGNGNDCLIGFAGDDELRGNQGYDGIEGGDGNDQLYGENSGVVLDGEGDVIFGGEGDDFLRGGPGKDELYGELGNDDLNGGNQADFLLGGPGNDMLDGYAGDDHLQGGEGNDALVGDAGDDELFGDDDRDKLDGEGGSDYLNGGSGDDFLRGGLGDDTLVSGDWANGNRLCGNGGDDVLWGGGGDQCLGGGSFLGGSDEVYGCADDTTTTNDCDNSAYDAW